MSDISDPNNVPATAEQVAKMTAFDGLYGAWLAARAVMAAGVDDDALWNKRQDELEDVERQFLFTPAPTKWRVWRKFEVLELAMNSEACASLADPARSVRALAAIKADLLRLGFNGD